MKENMCFSPQDQYQFIYTCVSQFINDRASKRLSLSDAAHRKASSQCKFEIHDPYQP